MCQETWPEWVTSNHRVLWRKWHQVIQTERQQLIVIKGLYLFIYLASPGNEHSGWKMKVFHQTLLCGFVFQAR